MKIAKKLMTILTLVLSLFVGILLGEYASPDHVLVIIIAAVVFVALVFTLGYYLGRNRKKRD